MVDHQSKEVVDKMSEELKIQPALLLPKKIVDSIQPVYVVNPVPGHSATAQIKSATISDLTLGVIHTTHIKKETFLVGAILSISKDVVSNSLFASIKITPIGSTSLPVIRIRFEPITAGEHTQTINFPVPIKLERGTTIEIENQSATASIDISASVNFYEVDPQ